MRIPIGFPFREPIGFPSGTDRLLVGNRSGSHRQRGQIIYFALPLLSIVSGKFLSTTEPIPNNDNRSPETNRRSNLHFLPEDLPIRNVSKIPECGTRIILQSINQFLQSMRTSRSRLRLHTTALLLEATYTQSEVDCTASRSCEVETVS